MSWTCSNGPWQEDAPSRLQQLTWLEPLALADAVERFWQATRKGDQMSDPLAGTRMAQTEIDVYLNSRPCTHQEVRRTFAVRRFSYEDAISGNQVCSPFHLWPLSPSCHPVLGLPGPNDYVIRPRHGSVRSDSSPERPDPFRHHGRSPTRRRNQSVP